MVFIVLFHTYDHRFGCGAGADEHLIGKRGTGKLLDIRLALIGKPLDDFRDFGFHFDAKTHFYFGRKVEGLTCSFIKISMFKLMNPLFELLSIGLGHFIGAFVVHS